MNRCLASGCAVLRPRFAREAKRAAAKQQSCARMRNRHYYQTVLSEVAFCPIEKGLPSQALEGEPLLLVGRAGFEPATNGLKVRQCAYFPLLTYIPVSHEMYVITAY